MKNSSYINNQHNEFLKLCCSDLSYPDIAKAMCVSVRTVETYAYRLHQILKVKTRIGLVLYAIENGLVEIKVKPSQTLNDHLMGFTVLSKKSFEEVASDFLEWSIPTFKEATTFSSLRKLEEEILEVEWALSAPSNPGHTKQEEYADCMMCLLDSASRAGVSLDEIRVAMHLKLRQNKLRTWVKNDDNTYSHVK